MRSDWLEDDRAGDADASADQRRLEVLDEDQREDVAARGAERHPDADFVRALADRVRGDAVDADGREQQRDHREPGQQHGAKPRRGQRVEDLRPRACRRQTAAAAD